VPINPPLSSGSSLEDPEDSGGFIGTRYTADDTGTATEKTGSGEGFGVVPQTSVVDVKVPLITIYVAFAVSAVAWVLAFRRKRAWYGSGEE